MTYPLLEFYLQLELNMLAFICLSITKVATIRLLCIQYEGHLWAAPKTGAPAWAPRKDEKEIVMIGEGRESVRTEHEPAPPQYRVVSIVW